MSQKTDAVVASTIGIDTGKNTLHLISLNFQWDFDSRTHTNGTFLYQKERAPLPAALVLTRNGAITPVDRAARSLVTSFEVTCEH
jgi:hypothetical protein